MALDLAVSASELNESDLDRNVLPPKERDGDEGTCRDSGWSVVESSESGLVVGLSWCNGWDILVPWVDRWPD